jgi:hypothetical protein
VVSSCEVWLSETWRVNAVHHVPTVLFLHLFGRLKDWWQQTLVLHKRTIMVAFSDTSRNA